MKIVITGAHFTPAMAVINKLRIMKQDTDIVYVGRSTTLEGDGTPSRESQILPKMGVEFIPIITGRLQREFTIYTVPSLLKIPIGLIQALIIILTKRPDVILSFGGYVAVPVVLAGWLFSIPIIVHEQTLVSGLANTISAFFADKVAVSFKASYPSNNHQMVLTGNPIREEILYPQNRLDLSYRRLISKAKWDKLPILVIFGGNQGSHTINKVVEESISKLQELFCIIHQTGDSKFKDFERMAPLQNDHYLLKKWIGSEIGAVLKKADFCFSRAGANTLTELAFLGKPALVIPFEPLYKNEQMRNAKYFESLGLVQIIPQSKLSSPQLFEKLKYMLTHRDSLKKSAQLAKKDIVLDAAKRLALETILLMKVKSNEAAKT